jgi:hypothetical protein
MLLYFSLLLLLKFISSFLYCTPHLFELLCCFKLLLCVSSLQAPNIASRCCAYHFFELMCCFKLLVIVVFVSSIQAPKVVGCCCVFHLLELLLNLLL